MKKTTAKDTNELREEVMKSMKANIESDLQETLDMISIGLDLSTFKKTQLDVSKFSKDTIRYLVDTYYQIQKLRKVRDNQLRAVMQGKDGEGFETSMFIATEIRNIENSIKSMIDYYTDLIPVCYWAKSNLGIGPIISAGLYARLDISKATSAGSFWSYCGLNDNKTPWLGVEKAKAVIKECLQENEKKLQIIIDMLQEAIENDKKFKTAFNKFVSSKCKLLEGKSAEEDEIMTEELFTDFIRNDSDFQSLLAGIGIRTIADIVSAAILKVYDPTIILSCDFNLIAIHEKVNRKPSQLFEGACNQRKSEKGKRKPYITKNVLEKFMAKPPYNKELKTLCYNIGECIKKQCNKEKALYGRMYKDRKAYETAKNERLEYKDQAEKALREKNFTNKDVIECYKSGKLTAGHIDMRSCRYAVKMFLSHFYEMYYLAEFGETPRTPYVLGCTDENLVMHKDYVYPVVKYEDVLRHFNLPVPEKVYPTPDEK